MHSFVFEHPSILLWIVPVVIALWLITLRSHASLAPDQRRQSLIVRSLAVALLIGAAATPYFTGPSRDQNVALLVDVSRSISPEQRQREFDWIKQAIANKPKGDTVEVEEFGENTSLITPPSRNPSPPENHVGVNGDSTDIAKALVDGEASQDPRLPRQVVLLSDGNETSGPSLTQTSGAAVPVSYVDPSKLYGNAANAEVSIARCDMPVTVHEKEPNVAHVLVVSNTAEKVTISASSDGEGLGAVQEAINRGKTVVNVPITLHGSGIHQISFRLTAPQDTDLDNNVGSVAVKVIGKPRVLYITDQPSSSESTLSKALASQSIELDVRSPLNTPTDAAGFAGYDSIVMNDTQASEISPAQQIAMQSAVRDYGAGFGLIGGPDSYIGGGWADTPVEQMLPVEMKLPKKLLPPPADIVVVLDASGSMGAEEDGVEKVQLGARAAVSLLGNLQPTDRVCVLAVTTEAVVTVPFSTPAQALAARGDIEGLEAGGGGIYCLTGLNAAYSLLEGSTAKIKHVIICPDTTDSEEQENCVERAAQELKEHNITTSMCGIGQPGDPDVPFQRAVAGAGGGQLFVVSKATDLPHFFQRDLQNLQVPPYRTGQFTLSTISGDRIIGDLGLASIPALDGYNISLAKPTASVPIKSSAYHEPVFAYQPYGLGKTFAYTSESDGGWSKPWQKWAGYTAFWSRVIRWSLRNDRPASFDAFADMPTNSTTGHIVVDAFDPAGNFSNGAVFQATITPPGGNAIPVPLVQTAPGRYEAPFDGSSVGGYLINIGRTDKTGDGIQTLAVSRAYSPELSQAPPNTPLLQALSQSSGGKMMLDPSDVWRFRPGSQPERYDLTALMLILALAAFIADIAWRLLGLRVQTQRVRTVSGAIISQVNSGVSSLGRRDRELVSVDAPAGSMPVGQNQIPLPNMKPQRGKARVQPGMQPDDLAILGGRSAIGDEDPFPLVADLDEIRRREHTKNRP